MVWQEKIWWKFSIVPSDSIAVLVDELPMIFILLPFEPTRLIWWYTAATMEVCQVADYARVHQRLRWKRERLCEELELYLHRYHWIVLALIGRPVVDLQISDDLLRRCSCPCACWRRLRVWPRVAAHYDWLTRVYFGQNSACLPYYFQLGACDSLYSLNWCRSGPRDW